MTTKGCMKGATSIPDEGVYRKYIETPLSSIALTLRIAPRRLLFCHRDESMTITRGKSSYHSR
jgi:hypothetical protein